MASPLEQKWNLKCGTRRCMSDTREEGNWGSHSQPSLVRVHFPPTPPSPISWGKLCPWWKHGSSPWPWLVSPLGPLWTVPYISTCHACCDNYNTVLTSAHSILMLLVPLLTCSLLHSSSWNWAKVKRLGLQGSLPDGHRAVARITPRTVTSNQPHTSLLPWCKFPPGKASVQSLLLSPWGVMTIDVHLSVCQLWISQVFS